MKTAKGALDIEKEVKRLAADFIGHWHALSTIGTISAMETHHVQLHIHRR